MNSGDVIYKLKRDMLFAIKVALGKKRLTDDVKDCLTSQKKQLEKSMRTRRNKNMNNKISMELDLQAEETINKLEKIKQILEDIKELDSNFNISNVIETNQDSILVFNADFCTTENQMKCVSKQLERIYGYKCIILPKGLKLDKAIDIKEGNNNFICACDYGQAKDYTVINYYKDEELIRTETIQYK